MRKKRGDNMKISDKLSKHSEFKDRLKEAMSIRGVSQTALVQATNIPKSAISQYLSGAFVPKDERLSVMARFLNVQEAWLRGYDAPMRRVTENSANSFDEDPLLMQIHSYIDTFSQEEREQLLQCLVQNDCINSSNTPFFLTPHEIDVMKAYRSQPEMQPAVDRLLGITEDGYVTVYAAANSASNHKHTITRIPQEKWDEIENEPNTDEELL